jgi:hypothetical protein
MRQRRREAVASDSNSPKIHHREGDLATVQIKPVSLLPVATIFRPLPVRLKLLTTGLASTGFLNLMSSACRVR